MGTKITVYTDADADADTGYNEHTLELPDGATKHGTTTGRSGK